MIKSLEKNVYYLKLVNLFSNFNSSIYIIIKVFKFSLILSLIWRLVLILNVIMGFDIYFLISLIISFLLSYFVLGGFKSSSDSNMFINYFKLFIKNFFVLNIFVFLIFSFGIYFEYFPVIECSSDDIPMNSDNDSSNNNKSITERDIINIKSESGEDGKDYYNFKIDKNKLDSVLNKSGEIVKNIGNNIAPNIGAGAAAGTVGGAVIKATASMPTTQRLGLFFVSTAVAAAGTKAGLSAAGALVNNMDLNDQNKNSKQGNPDIDRIPSPDDNMFNSALESGDLQSPLEIILDSQLTLNILLLVLVISLIIIMLNIFVLNTNINIINSYIIKYLPNKYTDKYKNYIEKGKEYNTMFMLVMFIINSILLILFILINIILSYELSNNTDDYVSVYNYIHNNKS